MKTLEREGETLHFKRYHTLQEQEIEIKNKNPIENLNRRKKKCNNVWKQNLHAKPMPMN